MGILALSNSSPKGEIDITENEIQDKSGGDFLSRGLVIIQTGWFVLQCIACQSAKHIPFTELKLVTLAFAHLVVQTTSSGMSLPGTKKQKIMMERWR